MILLKVDDGENSKEVKFEVDCENEETIIVELTFLLLSLGRDDKLRTAFIKAIDIAEYMIEGEV